MFPKIFRIFLSYVHYIAKIDLPLLHQIADSLKKIGLVGTLQGNFRGQGQRLQNVSWRTPPLVLIKKNTKCILVSIVSESQKGNKNWSLTKFWQNMLSKYEKGCSVVGASVISCTFVTAGV